MKYSEFLYISYILNRIKCKWYVYHFQYYYPLSSAIIYIHPIHSITIIVHTHMYKCIYMVIILNEWCHNDAKQIYTRKMENEYYVREQKKFKFEWNKTFKAIDRFFKLYSCYAKKKKNKKLWQTIASSFVCTSCIYFYTFLLPIRHVGMILDGSNIYRYRYR